MRLEWEKTSRVLVTDQETLIWTYKTERDIMSMCVWFRNSTKQDNDTDHSIQMYYGHARLESSKDCVRVVWKCCRLQYCHHSDNILHQTSKSWFSLPPGDRAELADGWEAAQGPPCHWEARGVFDVVWLGCWPRWLDLGLFEASRSRSRSRSRRHRDREAERRSFSFEE